MRYFSGIRNGYGIPFASDDWGGFTYFIEIDEQHVTRQVNLHENGVVVRYHRTHWCDDFGMMIIGRFSHKQKAGRDKTPITAAEFERIWTDALSSPTWNEQVDRSREKEWGSWSDRVASWNTRSRKVDESRMANTPTNQALHASGQHNARPSSVSPLQGWDRFYSETWGGASVGRSAPG